MFLDLIAEIVATYRAPRAAIRRVIDRVENWSDVALIFGVAYCISSIAAVAVALVFDGGAGAGIVSLVSSLVFSVVAYAIIAALIFQVGRFFGGKAAFIDIVAAIGWHSLATSPFAPIVALAAYAVHLEGGRAIFGLAQLGVAVVAIWLLSKFVAEAHGFQSALRVGFALIAGAMAIGLVFSALLAGFIS